MPYEQGWPKKILQRRSKATRNKRPPKRGKHLVGNLTLDITEKGANFHIEEKEGQTFTLRHNTETNKNKKRNRNINR